LKQNIIHDRFYRFQKLIESEKLITSGEFRLSCCNGGVSECSARFALDGLIGAPVSVPAGYDDRRGDVQRAFQEVLKKVEDGKFTGEAELLVKSFLGTVYRVELGYRGRY